MIVPSLCNPMSHSYCAFFIFVFVRQIRTWLCLPFLRMIGVHEAAGRLFLNGFNFGILCFPYAFRKSGLVFGCLLLIGVTLITNSTTKLLMKTKNHLTNTRGVTITNLPEVRCIEPVCSGEFAHLGRLLFVRVALFSTFYWLHFGLLAKTKFCSTSIRGTVRLRSVE